MAFDKVSQVLAASLVDELTARYKAAGLAVALSFDASQNAVITVGTAAAGSQSAVVRILPYPSIGVDGLGLTQTSYGPHTMQVVLEQLAGNTGTTVCTAATLAQLNMALLRRGARVETYLTANTTAVSVAGITGTPAAVVDSLQYPLTSTI